MDFLLSQGITETIEIKEAPPQTKTEDPIGGSVKEEITIPVQPTPPVWGLNEIQIPSKVSIIFLLVYESMFLTHEDIVSTYLLFVDAKCHHS